MGLSLKLKGPGMGKGISRSNWGERSLTLKIRDEIKRSIRGLIIGKAWLELTRAGSLGVWHCRRCKNEKNLFFK
jgi:hypothetical protein